MPKLYTLTYILNPALHEDDARGFTSAAETKIAELGGIIKNSARPVKTNLGYEIKEHNTAWVGSVTFSTEQQFNSSIEEFLKNQPSLLRFATFSTRPEPIMPMRFKTKVLQTVSTEPSAPLAQTSPPQQEAKEKPKVDIKEIEKKLEELLQ